MSVYLTLQHALLANGYALESARKIAKRLSKVKKPFEAFNQQYGKLS